MSFSIEQSLSLMIPRVFPQWIDEVKIIDIFHKQHIGRVYKVSIIRMPDSKKRSYPIYQAFVYFSAWYDTEIAFNFQQRIFGPRAQARVVYDDPWYWVVFENKKRHLSNNDKRMIRLGYQAYVNERTIENLTDRVRELENAGQPSYLDTIGADDAVDAWSNVPESHLKWNLTDSFAMDTLGDELKLTETAMSVAEAALEEEVCKMDISFNDVSEAESWNNVPWLSFQQIQLETAATEILGVELALAETAISVAESAIEEEQLSEELQEQYIEHKHRSKMDLDYSIDDYNSDESYYKSYDREDYYW